MLNGIASKAREIKSLFKIPTKAVEGVLCQQSSKNIYEVGRKGTEYKSKSVLSLPQNVALA